MSALNAFMDITVITTDGRSLVGTLVAYDRATNLVLSHTQERIITPNEETEVLELGAYILRGESVACCGLVEEDLDEEIDWKKVRAKTLISTKHKF